MNAGPVLLGLAARSGSNWFEAGVCSGCWLLGPCAGDERVEKVESDLVWVWGKDQSYPLVLIPFNIIDFRKMALSLDIKKLWLFPEFLRAFNWTTEK